MKKACAVGSKKMSMPRISKSSPSNQMMDPPDADEKKSAGRKSAPKRPVGSNWRLGKPLFKHSAAHPGFKAVAKSMATKQGIPLKAASAELASSTRRSSPAAKAANPRLKRVRG